MSFLLMEADKVVDFRSGNYRENFILTKRIYALTHHNKYWQHFPVEPAGSLWATN